MDLYEYQARQLLEEQDIPTPDAIFAQNSHEVAEAADKIGYPCVIKAQVKIGHRGQAASRSPITATRRFLNPSPSCR